MAFSRSGTSELKKVPPPPSKYDAVPAKVDSHNPKAKVPVVPNAVLAKRRNELFSRIQPSAVHRLISSQDQRATPESIYAQVQGVARASSTATAATEATTVTSTVDRTDSGMQARHESTLILDMRGSEEHAKGHIIGAVSFPSTRISQDKFTADLIRFKGAPEGKRIICYHSDDKSSAPHATLLVEKGWSNVSIISGGIEEVARLFPSCIEGIVDVPSRPPTAASTVSGATRASKATKLR
ncbi:unnamed protein product [Vitrella brassicaformis CCMP3155]|uniref:Rhodanese domain-containing protein n=2 Tax=Vitrella brassicaformis TaxID=1169539 RepID=A0A0G4GLK0_VITBC|nr:unnamed protein product [Vitrella brassicaformis CCMP3155]|eukprot:CEM30993.1 unnamed protein product [Vitrella brassicaformis CCMP3155]